MLRRSQWRNYEFVGGKNIARNAKYNSKISNLPSWILFDVAYICKMKIISKYFFHVACGDINHSKNFVRNLSEEICLN